MQESPFIENDYLEFKRRNLGFLHRSSLKNKQTTNFGRTWAQERMVLGEWALEIVENSASDARAHESGTWVVSLVRFLAFSPRFSV